VSAARSAQRDRSKEPLHAAAAAAGEDEAHRLAGRAGVKARQRRSACMSDPEASDDESEGHAAFEAESSIADSQATRPYAECVVNGCGEQFSCRTAGDVAKALAAHCRKCHRAREWAHTEVEELKTHGLNVCGCGVVLSDRTRGHRCGDKRSKRLTAIAKRTLSQTSTLPPDSQRTLTQSSLHPAAAAAPPFASAADAVAAMSPSTISAIAALPQQPVRSASSVSFVGSAGAATAAAAAASAPSLGRSDSVATIRVLSQSPSPARAAAVRAAAAIDPLEGVDCLRSRAVTFSRLPRELWPLWKAYCTPIVGEYARAKRAGDEAARCRALCDLLDAPQVLLKRNGGIPAVRKRFTDVQLNVDRKADHKDAKEEKYGCANSSYGGRNGVYVVPDDLYQQRRSAVARRAQGILNSGAPKCFRKAAASTMQSQVAPATAQSYDRLRALHPVTAATPIPVCPAGPRDFVSVDGRQLARVVQDYRGQAPGPSGWTADLLAILLDDEEMRNGFACIVTDIANGDARDRVLHLRLIACVVVGLVKDESTGKLRPIAMGELFLKCACASIIRSNDEHIRVRFGAIQFGIGRSGGSEAAAVVVNNAMCGGDDLAVLALDQGNAYNSIPRQLVMQELYSRPELREFWRVADFAYNTPSPLLMYGADGKLVSDDIFCSQQGVRQGCALGGLLYANAVQPMYDAAAAAAGDGMVCVVAVMDDLLGVGRVPALRRFHAQFSADCTMRAMELNADKSSILWPNNSAVPAEALRFASDCGFQAPVTGAMQWVGTAIGKDPRRLREVLDQINNAQHQRLFDALSSADIGAQNAVLMLRACILPRATYALRTAAPDLIAGFASQFDRDVRSTLASIVQRKLTAGADPFAAAGDSYRLPLAGGGLGLRSACDVSAAAYVGAVALAISYMSDGERTVLIARGGVHDGLTLALERLRVAGATGVLCMPQPPMNEQRNMSAAQRAALKPRSCASVREFVAHYTAVSAVGLHLQRQLTAQFEAHKRSVLITDQKTRARLDSAGDKNAYRWLTTAPSEPQFRMADLDVVRALRHRMGIAPTDGLVQCKCGIRVTDANANHFHDCQTIRRDALDARHTVVLRSLARIAAVAGVPTQMDYASHAAKQRDGSRLRPDGRLFGLHSTGADVIIDVSITNPTSASLFPRANAKLAVAAIREQTKNAKYRRYVEREQSVFCAFVAESYGAFGVSMREVIAALARRASERIAPGSEQFGAWSYTQWALRVVSAAVQRGNSKLVDVALDLSRGRMRQM